jgi:NAD(P)-dependent dehydrogenase (short-subunit alcohol dehydrogenase family)
MCPHDQLKETIPELRKTKGCVAWVSSGAAVSCYTAWGAYGSSKAAMNSLAGHLTVEEPDITSVCISPGRVDTEMQKVIRENGGEMKEADLQDFTEVFEKGELYAPETPGNAIAQFVMDPKREQSGGFFR